MNEVVCSSEDLVGSVCDCRGSDTCNFTRADGCREWHVKGDAMLSEGDHEFHIEGAKCVSNDGGVSDGQASDGYIRDC